MINLVEMLDEDPNSGFNQKCAHGNLVAGHAVYCHNDNWRDSPRKCRRTWYHGDREAARLRLRDEDCPGFELNIDYLPKDNT